MDFCPIPVTAGSETLRAEFAEACAWQHKYVLRLSLSQDRNRIWILMNLVPEGVINCDLFAQGTHAGHVVEFDSCRKLRFIMKHGQV